MLHSPSSHNMQGRTSQAVAAWPVSQTHPRMDVGARVEQLLALRLRHLRGSAVLIRDALSEETLGTKLAYLST